MRVRLWHSSFYFGHCDHRQEPNEKQKQRSEDSYRANVRPDIHPCRMIDSPGRREEIAYQTAGNNDEPLEPHAGVHAHRDKENDKNVSAAPAEPKELWREAIAEEHAQPPVPPVRSENAIPKCEPLVRIPAIPRHKKFHHIRVGDERT